VDLTVPDGLPPGRRRGDGGTQAACGVSDWTESFEDRLDLTSPLTDEQLSGVPARRGLLALLDAGGRPIILLTAADIRARLSARLAEPLADRSPAATTPATAGGAGPGRKSRTVNLRQVARAVLWHVTTSHFQTDLAFLHAASRIWPKSCEETIGWKPAWFVHVDPAGAYPHFQPARQFPLGGMHLGPFTDGRSANQFVAALQDAFDLCRNHSCLRQSPHGPPCAYAQMGKCLSPCDGTISMEDYRLAVAEAAGFAAGTREPVRRRLARQMSAAAGRLEFERAAAIKARLDRLADLDGPAYRCVLPFERFQYLFVHRGPTTRQASLFLVDRGWIDELAAIEYPLRAEQLDAVLLAAGRMTARPACTDRPALLRVGLAANYIFGGQERRGVVLHWRDGLAAAELAEAVEAGRDLLRLRPPRPPRPPKAPKADPPPDKEGAKS